MMIHPTEKNVQAVAFYYDRLHWKVIDPAIAQDMEYLSNLDDGDMTVVSRSLDDKVGSWSSPGITDRHATIL